MSLDSTTRPGGLARLPVAILATFLLVAAFGVAVFLLATPAPVRVAAPVPTLHEYSNAESGGAVPAGPATPPDAALLSAVGDRACAVTDGCVSQTVTNVQPGRWQGEAAWLVSYRVVMRDGLRFTLNQWYDAAGRTMLGAPEVSR
jgi:hypothetical protein